MATTDYAPATQPGGGGIRGASWDVEAACNTAATTTAKMCKESFAFGSVRVPNGSSITSITWYGAAYSTDTAVALKDEDGVAVTQTVAADELHQLPSALAGVKYAVPVTDAAGTLYFHWER